MFILRAQGWGVDREDALALVAGKSPASAGVSDELDRLVAAIGGRPVSSVAEIRALGQVAAALDDFLAIHGWRVIDGYDVDGTTLVESPQLVVQLANRAPRPARLDELATAEDSARRRVPPEHRSEFDALLDDARQVCGLREDNSGILIAWPIGLLRRAMLAAGGALGLPDRNLTVEATVAAIDAALRGHERLDAADLAARSARRRSVLAADAPRTLGPPEDPPPQQAAPSPAALERNSPMSSLRA